MPLISILVPKLMEEQNYQFYNFNNSDFEVIEASNVIMSDEVIEATEVFRTTYTLDINKPMAKMTLFSCFEKRNF
jgi:hypothetical protein